MEQKIHYYIWKVKPRSNLAMKNLEIDSKKILERKIVRADFVSEKGHSCRAIFYRIFGPSESSSSRHCYFILKGMR